MTPETMRMFESIENNMERVEQELKESIDGLRNETRFLKTQNHRLQVRIDDLCGTTGKLRERIVELESGIKYLESKTGKLESEMRCMG